MVLFVFGQSGAYMPNFGVYNEEAVKFQQSQNSTQTHALREI
jgi:hypothetical protein